MKIFLAGATGAIGRRLVPLLLNARHSVIGTTRSTTKADGLRAAGVEAVVVDVFDAQALSAAVFEAHPDIIVNHEKARRGIYNIAEPSGIECCARISRLSASKQKLSSVGKFHALEDAITIRRRTPVFVDDVRTIRDQAAEFSEGTGPIDGRHTVTRSQQSNLCAMADREGIRYHDQTTIRLACLCSNNEFELGPVVNGCDDRFHAKERSSGFEWAQVIFDKCRHCRVEQQGHPGDARRDILQ